MQALPRPAAWAAWLGRVAYRDAWSLQRALAARRAAAEIPDTILLLEHPAIYTIGRSGSAANILLSDDERTRLGIDLAWVDRGGDVTYHGPGQLVGYPIVDIRARGGDLHRYLRDVEDVLLRVLADYCVAGARDDRFTGVWVGQRKVAAIGVKVARGVTSHGFALNVDPEMGHWDGIVPCGITGRGVVSLAQLVAPAPALVNVRGRVLTAYGEVFGVELSEVDSGKIGWNRHAAAV